MRRTRTHTTGHRTLRRGLLGLSLLAATASAAACGRPEIAQIEVAGQVFGEDDHQQSANFEVGDRFTVVLPGLPRGVGPLASLPKRPRSDGEIVKFSAMGRVSASQEAELGSPGMAYVFDVVGEGRGRVTVFDAANRDRFVLRTSVGAEAAKQVKSVGPAKKAKAPPKP